MLCQVQQAKNAIFDAIASQWEKWRDDVREVHVLKGDDDREMKDGGFMCRNMMRVWVRRRW